MPGLDPARDAQGALVENGLFSDERPVELLLRVERALRSSSTTLSRCGAPEAAARAEKWASWLQLVEDEPDAVERVFTSMNGSTPVDDPSLLDRALEETISLVGASFGNIQLADSLNGTLRIAAQRGFDQDFLDYFAEVEDASSACGRAAEHRAQMVIPDVDRDDDFAPHREIAAASGFRAVQSTPIVSPSGRVLGILSTHFRRPYRPTRRQLRLVDWYAHRIGATLSREALLPPL